MQLLYPTNTSQCWTIVSSHMLLWSNINLDFCWKPNVLRKKCNPPLQSRTQISSESDHFYAGADFFLLENWNALRLKPLQITGQGGHCRIVTQCTSLTENASWLESRPESINSVTVVFSRKTNRVLKMMTMVLMIMTLIKIKGARGCSHLIIW